MNTGNLVDTFVEIDILEDENFLKIRETLTRMGIANMKEKNLYQSCHILHKKDRYYIVHFKELLALDGLEVDFGEDDLARRNTIARTLERWGLCRIVEPSKVEEPVLQSRRDLYVVRFQERSDWNLIQKYTIGGKR